MTDLINVRDPVARAIELCAMKVPIVCLHTAFDLRGSGDIFYLLEMVRPVVGSQLAIAGGLTNDTLGQALSKGADIIVVGGGIIRPKRSPRGCTHDHETTGGRNCPFVIAQNPPGTVRGADGFQRERRN